MAYGPREINGRQAQAVRRHRGSVSPRPLCVWRWSCDHDIVRVMPATGAIFALALSSVLGADARKTLSGNAEHTSGFNQHWLDTVVSIEQETGAKRVPQGTGFVVTFDGLTVLVTARHVVTSGNGQVLPGLVFVRSDIDGELTAAAPWIISRSNLDLACVLIARPSNERGLLSIQTDLFLSRSIVEVGAPVLVLGYPAGLRSKAPFFKEPIVRSGIVSRVSGDGITLDSQIFPGN